MVVFMMRCVVLLMHRVSGMSFRTLHFAAPNQLVMFDAVRGIIMVYIALASSSPVR